MLIRTSFFLAAFAFSLLAWVETHASPLPELSDLPDFYNPLSQQPYKVDPYIRMAVALQSLGHTAALDKLRVMARNPRADARVIILSRMLFAPREGSDLRRPFIGGAVFLGGTDYSDWPQEPIEIDDGIPFLITRSYVLGGKPEPDEEYLDYCETHGDWSALTYRLVDAQQERDTLQELVGSTKWKASLTESERKFLAAQIE